MPDGDSWIGHRLRRREDHRLLTGAGRFTADLIPPASLHLAVVRSPVAHGHLRAIDLAAAREAPGVVGAFTAADLPEAAAPIADGAPPGVEPHPRPVLAQRKVRYQGEPVAVIAAESPYAAADAAALAAVDLDPLDAAPEVDAATAPDAPALHEELDGNVAGTIGRAFGDDPAPALAGAAATVRLRLRAGRVAGAYLEPRAVVAHWDEAAGSLLLHTSTQAVFQVRASVAAALGLEPECVRVVAEDVGGGFGAKGMCYPEEILAAALSRRLGRPVAWVAARSEDTATTAQAHGDVVEVELGADADGRLLGLRADLLHDIGAYTAGGAGQSDNIAGHMVCAYRLPALALRSRLVHTNAVPSGFIRGGGREVGNFAIERAMDALARQLALDPVELRRRNLVPPERMPYDTGYPHPAGVMVYDGGDYPRLLAEALEGVGYEDVRRRQEGGAALGVGVACCVEQTGMGLPELARVHVSPAGEAVVRLGSTPQGQGHATVFAQVVADRLGWPLERVQVRTGDTTHVRHGMNTAGSRSALEVGNAAALAGASARRRLLELASERLEAEPADLELGPEGAAVQGAPGSLVPLSELVGPDGLDVEETYQSSKASASGCHAALVELDAATGTPRLLRYVIAHDSGRAINPLLVEGQLHGGWAHGVGYALFEEAAYDADGNLTAASFLDYGIVSAPEVAAPLELRHVGSPVLGNPEGFKGVGEA
ncbi:MAG TPA: xanthine dehydrogenase family protein molybdopterin-binding subunit, partial [Candidatus Binatia bacterium]|nr:xanthine dehydrogenase family protein molybdopterin-binding subunit [Candidatus Binatia bacterium]